MAAAQRLAPGRRTGAGLGGKRMEKNEQRNATRFWAGVLGASALGLVIVIGVVMQLRGSKPELTSRSQPPRTQAAVRAQAPAAMKPAAAARPAAAVKPTAVAKPAAKAAAVNPQTAVKPLTAGERKTSEMLWVEEKKLETDITRVMAASDGRQRVAAAIAKHFNVPEKVVRDLRARKVAHGEITVTLALAQQVLKHEKMTHQRAVDRVLALRNSGQGWGAIAKTLNLRLGDALDHLQSVEKQVAKLDVGKKAAKG